MSRYADFMFEMIVGLKLAQDIPSVEQSSATLLRSLAETDSSRMTLPLSI